LFIKKKSNKKKVFFLFDVKRMLWFYIFVFILTLLLIAISIYNIVAYVRLRNLTTIQGELSSESTWGIALNSILLIFAIILFIWSGWLMFDTIRMNRVETTNTSVLAENGVNVKKLSVQKNNLEAKPSKLQVSTAGLNQNDSTLKISKLQNLNIPMTLSTQPSLTLPNSTFKNATLNNAKLKKTLIVAK
jgi:hypothetical protein